MIKISTIGFAQLRNAEHVSFLNNVSVAIEKVGVESLGIVPEQFTSMYNERVTEKSGTTTELTKKLRAASEELYGVLMLTVEYKCNTAPESETGQACAGIVGVVNQLIKDVKHNLNLRLGKGAETETETETLQTSL